MSGPEPLPYRTDSVALASWLESRARGRSAEQLRQAAAAPKGVEGTAAAAAAMGFVDAAGGALTETGEQFALASESERRVMVGEALRAYPPYATLLQALRDREEVETEVRWIEAWWSTRGFGSSESNRREGAAAFGRLAEFAGLAEYIPGRRGRPTRLRWLPAAASAARSTATAPRPDSARRDAAQHTRIFAAADPDLVSEATVDTPTAVTPPHTAAAVTADPVGSPAPIPDRYEHTPHPAPPAAEPELNRIILPLESGAVARIEVPGRLPRAEKRRLLDLLHLLITED